MDLLPEIDGRRSVHAFSKQPVEKPRLERILKAGQLAPSAKNRQEWRFVVVQKVAIREAIQAAAFGQPHVGQAPVVIAICPTNIDYRMPNGQLSHPVDTSIAAAFMMLQAAHEGLATCCVTTFDEQEVKELLSIPYAIPVTMLLLVGYADEQPPAPGRKPLKQIASYNHW